MLSVSIGTVAWASIAFLLVLVLLKKFAWGPVLSSLKEREESIANALQAADQAREEMAKLQSQNEDLLRQARIERDILLKEAREAKDSIIAESKVKAQEEADKIMVSTRENIHLEKMAAISELKNQVAVLSIEIAEKIIKEHLSDSEKQKTLVQNLMNDVNLN
jgi:F-type H+-transporting ATPase subunit b